MNENFDILYNRKLESLSDVETAGLEAGKVLKWNGTAWYMADDIGEGIGSPWNQIGSDIYYNNGNVGIGTATPGERLYVVGNVKANGKFYTKSGSTTSSSAIVVGSGEYSGGNIWKIYATATIDGFSIAYGEFTLFIRPNSTTMYHIITVGNYEISFSYSGGNFVLNTGYEDLTWTAMRVN